MKFENTLLPNRLSKIDETNRSEHAFLAEDDVCFHYGEWTGTGFQGSPTNQLILNFKTKPSVAAADSRRAYYKQRDLESIAATLRRTISANDIDRVTWVPIPTSKVLGHPDYDDRLTRVLTTAFRGYAYDVRSLVRQTASTEADHQAQDRLTPHALKALLDIDTVLLARAPVRSTIYLFDDVITTGKHFKCCQARLREVVPGDVPIRGLFVARRALPNVLADFEDLSAT